MRRACRPDAAGAIAVDPVEQSLGGVLAQRGVGGTGDRDDGIVA